MKINKSIASILLLGLISAIIQGCNKTTDTRQQLRNVILTMATSTAGNEVTVYPGIVEEGANINAAFMADGKIGRILVKEGDRVKKGQLLATLDDSDYRIGVAQLEAQFDQMTKEKERMDAMYAKHNVAPNDYEKFETGYKQLGLQLDMAKRKLDYTRLYAPADGYVATKYMSEGELVGAGTPVFNIVDDTRMMASIDLPVGVYLERNLITGASGEVPGVANPIPLEIISFTPDADNNMLYRMKLAVPLKVSKELTPGMNISVSILKGAGNTDDVAIPSRSVFSENGKTYVWLYDNNDSTIHKKEVEIEGVPDGRMNKVKGLEVGATIIETGVKQLYEGEKVNVINSKSIE